MRKYLPDVIIIIGELDVYFRILQQMLYVYSVRRDICVSHSAYNLVFVPSVLAYGLASSVHGV